MPHLYMQVSQSGTERKVCIEVFLCCQGYAIMKRAESQLKVVGMKVEL